MFGIISAIVAGIASIAGIGLNYYNQKKLNQHLTGSQQEQNQWNDIQAQIQRDFTSEEAQKSRDFTEYMARNKYAMETQSMQDAGVNPAMVYGGGSLVPTASNGAVGSGALGVGQGAGNAGVPALLGLSDSLMSLIRTPLEMEKLKEEIKNIGADTGVKEGEAESKRIQNEITQATKDSLIRFTNMAPEQREAEVNKVVQETKSEEIKTQILSTELLQSKLDYKQNERMYDLIFEMQEMENSYQQFVNNHQEKQWEKEYDKLCADVYKLYTSAAKDMSDIEVNNFQKGLISAEAMLTEQKTKTEEMNTTKTMFEAGKIAYDPYANLTRGAVNLGNALRGINDKFNMPWKDVYVKGKEAYTKQHERYLHANKQRQVALQVKEMLSTTGQAISEYGD